MALLDEYARVVDMPEAQLRDVILAAVCSLAVRLETAPFDVAEMVCAAIADDWDEIKGALILGTLER